MPAQSRGLSTALAALCLGESTHFYVTATMKSFAEAKKSARRYAVTARSCNAK